MAVTATSLQSGVAPGNGLTRRSVPISPVSPARHTMTNQAVANVTHDLRAPLSVLSITLELLEDPSSHTTEELKHLLDSMRRSVAWMDGLVDNLATSVALEQNRVCLLREAVQIGQCIERAVSVLQPLLDRRGQSVNVVCPAEHSMVYVDTVRIGQVLANLLANASAYGACYEPISVTVTAALDKVQIMVTDSGPGMTDDEQRRVFDRGVRGAQGLESRASGQGLGLSIVKSLVEMHGGEVGISSVLGQGSSFWFTLPHATDVRAGTHTTAWIQ